MLNSMNDLREAADYSTPPNSIVSNVLSTQDGWRVETRLPQSAPASDRESVLKWLEEYQQEIRKKHPLWDMFLVVGENLYCLEVKRTNNARELLNSLQEKAVKSWGNGPTYGK